MALDPVQAEDRDAPIAIKRPTQAPPDTAQRRLRHFEATDAEGDPELLGGDALPRTDQPEQLAPRQPPGDDGQRGGGLPGSGSDQGTKGPVSGILVEPRAKEPERIYQRIPPARAIEPRTGHPPQPWPVRPRAAQRV